MQNLMNHDPAAAIQWVALLFLFGAMYVQMRRWEKSVSGKIDQIDIKQPLDVRQVSDAVTKQECSLYRGPMGNRLSALENRMDRVERKMEADKEQIIHAGEERMARIEARIVDVEDKLRADIKEVLRAVSRLEGGQK